MNCDVPPGIVRLILTRYLFTRSLTLVYLYMFEYAKQSSVQVNYHNWIYLDILRHKQGRS